MLSEDDQQHYSELFAPYLKGHAGQYVYRLKKEDLPLHLRRLGEDMRRLLKELEARYSNEPVYHVLARVFAEHFRLEEETLRVKEGSELSASSLQSPDDLEATYRKKGGQGQRGYAINVSESCERQNPLQLITQVHVASNNTDDSTLLAQVLAELKARTGVETLLTDGGYGSAQNDQLLAEHQVTLIQTAIRGRPQDAERLHLEDFQVQMNASHEPEQLTCPKVKTGQVQASSSGEGWIAVFGEGCATCEVQHRCPVAKKKRLGTRALRFKREDLQRAERRRRLRQHQEEGRNLRAAVESTIRSIKHGFAGGKAPVGVCFVLPVWWWGRRR